MLKSRLLYATLAAVAIVATSETCDRDSSHCTKSIRLIAQYSPWMAVSKLLNNVTMSCLSLDHTVPIRFMLQCRVVRRQSVTIERLTSAVECLLEWLDSDVSCRPKPTLGAAGGYEEGYSGGFARVKLLLPFSGVRYPSAVVREYADGATDLRICHETLGLHATADHVDNYQRDVGVAWVGIGVCEYRGVFLGVLLIARLRSLLCVLNDARGHRYIALKDASKREKG
uniref:25kDa outer membrane protein n=1 Tax=Legionella pneumophila TaxID=446 RepID=Q48810_LEGPN|nr:ORF [Legionella pneumophila]